MIKIDIQKRLQGVDQDIDLAIKLQIKRGDFIALSGVSGSGKTTLLRILAGLESADGVIEVDKKIWQDKNIVLSPQKRGVGFVFQDYALFPNMNILNNLLYVNNDISLATHLLKITELTGLEKKYPHTLSGGQKQRVALCRALMNKPSMLLLDEPLSALDTQIKEKLYEELLILHKEFNTTTIMVSHDIDELNKLASRIITIKYGKIIDDRSTSSDKVSLIDIKEAGINYIASILIDNKVVDVEIPKDRLKK